MIEIAITKASEDDAEAIALLVSELGYPTDADRMRTRLHDIGRDDDYETFVARADRQVVGVVGTRIGSLYEADEPYGQIMALAVSRSWHRRGIGRRLMVAAESALIRRGARVLVVASGNRRADAHAFYERCGYLATGRSFRKSVRG